MIVSQAEYYGKIQEFAGIAVLTVRPRQGR